MIACTSPAFTARVRPLRIGLSATVAWRFSILNKFYVLEHEPQLHRERIIAGVEHPMSRPAHEPLRVRATTGLQAFLYVWARRGWDSTKPHPTLPSRLIPSNFCASTANSI